MNLSEDIELNEPNEPNELSELNHPNDEIKTGKIYDPSIFVGKIKKFDAKLLEKYDAPAREIVKTQLGEYVEDNPNIYDQDMILKIPNIKYKYLELQVCTQWKEDQYPYKLPFVYARKKLFGPETMYLIFNSNMTQGLLFDQPSLCEKPRRLKRYSRYWVYEVPWNRVLKVCDLEALSVEHIKMYS